MDAKHKKNLWNNQDVFSCLNLKVSVYWRMISLLRTHLEFFLNCLYQISIFQYSFLALPVINWLQLFPYEHFNWANLLMETEIDGVEKKPFLPFHPSCIVDSCQKPYPYCDSPFLSLTWVNGLNFHYGKHTGSKGIFVPLFSFLNHIDL